MKLDDTIDIMETLTKGEKRSISITIDRNSKSKEPTEQHFRLYNFLSSIIKDTERVIDQSKKNETIKNKIQLEKNKDPKLFTSLNVIRLYDFIFDNLRSMNANKKEFKLDNDLQDIQILHNKGLGNQGFAIIEKARKEAEKDERFTNEVRTLQFLMLERKACLASGKSLKHLKKLSNSCRIQYKRIKEVLDTMDDQELILYNVNKGKIPNDVINDVSPVFKLLRKNPEEKKRLSFDAALRGLHATSLYLKRDPYKYRKDFEKMFDHVGHMIDLFKGNETRKKQRQRAYIKSCLALANACIETGYRQPFDDYLDEFKLALGIDPSRPTEQEVANITIDKYSSRDHYTLIHVFTSYYVGTGDLNTAVRIIQQIKNSLEIYKPPTGHLVAMYWLIGSIYFLAKDYDSSRVYVDKLLDKAVAEENRSDIILQARLLDLLLIYESNIGKEKRLLTERIGLMYTKLGNTPDGAKVSRHIIQNAFDTLHTFSATLTFPDTNRAVTLEEFKKLYIKLTEGMGDFITNVFALWARQKIKSLS